MSDSEGETVELLSVVSAGADPHDFSVSFAKQNGAVAEDHDHDVLSCKSAVELFVIALTTTQISVYPCILSVPAIYFNTVCWF